MKVEVAPGLPIADRAEEIADALRDHQVVVVAGETGSGKTTQLPKIAHLLGRRAIVHTQPRRIAARSVAARIAQECEVELGREVGYAVRFDDRTSDATEMRLVTDGLLLSEIHHDPDLRRYDTVIVDEAHERSLAIDFLLGYLKRLLPRRPDLKVVVTSATIDVERFSAMFDDAPVVEVSGRTYPVEIRYRPLTDPESGMLDGITDAISELPRDGDVLVFLSGEREIRDAAEHLAGKKWRGTEVLPLYGRLAAQDQQRIFSSHPGRRIVLATNVAETSLTVPGIRYVVDTGYARISRYSQRLKVQRLPIEPVSRASAAQRAGRCGRVADGICIRLYDEDDHDGRPEFTDPEILRTNLASVLLQMASLDLGAVEDFPFLDPPDRRAVGDGRALLAELGALVETRDGRPRLTRLGRTMSRLPVDPRMARMLLAADRQGCLADVLVIVAGLSIQDPRERPAEQQAQADQLHARFRSPSGDFLSWLVLWEHVREKRDELSNSAFRRLCRDEMLHYLRIREWQDVHSQLRRTVRDLGMKPGKVGADPDDVHRALLTGLLSHVGVRQAESKEFLGARGARFMVFPGSSLAKKPPRWVVAGELVETGRLWGRTVAAIQPEWVEQAAGDLVTRQYAEPHWSSRRGAAMAKERVLLYGLPLVVDRLVPLGRHDPQLAREMFVRHALVQGEWRTRHHFWARNAERIAAAEEVEDRVRRRGLRVDDDVLFDFYDQRVPADVVSVRHFDAWWKKTRQEQPDLLDLDPALLAADAGDVERDFPTTWTSESSDYTVSYSFEPGTADDGVTIDVPLEQLLSVDEAEFLWNVPGHREELVVALVRSLPKRLRRELVPVPDHASALLRDLDPAAGPLLDQLVRGIRQRTGTVVTAADFDLDTVPEHLKVVFRVVDDGRELARGRDLGALRTELVGEVRRELDAVAASSERTGITTWDVGTIERTVPVGQVTGHPALVDPELDGTAPVGKATSVTFRVLDSEVEQHVAMVGATARLVALSTPTTTPALGRTLDLRQKLLLASSPYRDAAAVLDDCRLAALDELVVRHGGPVWDEAAFTALREKVRADVHDTAAGVVRDVLRALEKLAQVQPSGGSEAAEDVRVQLSWLVHPGFVRDHGVTQVRRLPVYLEAARRRLALPATDAIVQLQDLEVEFHERTADLSPLRMRAPDVREVRWALEELRVSLVAQNLGTPYPVSLKRLRKLLDALAV